MDSVQHFELPYKSRERAKKFYFDAFDWQLFDVPGPGNYSLATTVATEANGMPKRPGAINGGLVGRSKELQGPTLLVHVGDVQSALARIGRAGGTVLGEPWAMGPVFMARFRDPEGNVMGIFEDRPEAQERPGKPTKKAAKPKAKKAAKKPAKAAKKASRKKR